MEVEGPKSGSFHEDKTLTTFSPGSLRRLARYPPIPGSCCFQHASYRYRWHVPSVDPLNSPVQNILRSVNRSISPIFTGRFPVDEGSDRTDRHNFSHDAFCIFGQRRPDQIGVIGELRERRSQGSRAFRRFDEWWFSKNETEIAIDRSSRCVEKAGARLVGVLFLLVLRFQAWQITFAGSFDSVFAGDDVTSTSPGDDIRHVIRMRRIRSHALSVA
jgi:hypothetical protein